MRRLNPNQALAGRQTQRLALGVQLLEALGAMRHHHARQRRPRLIQDTDVVFGLTPIDPDVNWHVDLLVLALEAHRRTRVTVFLLWRSNGAARFGRCDPIGLGGRSHVGARSAASVGSSDPKPETDGVGERLIGHTCTGTQVQVSPLVLPHRFSVVECTLTGKCQTLHLPQPQVRAVGIGSPRSAGTCYWVSPRPSARP